MSMRFFDKAGSELTMFWHDQWKLSISELTSPVILTKKSDKEKEFSKSNNQNIMRGTKIINSSKRVRVSNFEWNEEMSIRLIKMIEKFENLWNKNSDHYKNREMRENSWQTISKELDIAKLEITIHWNALRSNYSAYRKKVNETKSGRCGRKRKPPNPIFIEMKFLDPIMSIESNHRQTNVVIKADSATNSTTSSVTSEINSEPMTESNDFTQLAMNDDSLNSSTAKRPRSSKETKTTQQSEIINLMQNAYKTLADNNQIDEHKMFTDVIAQNLRKWTSENKTFALRYRAALSSLNARFETEAAENSAIISSFQQLKGNGEIEYVLGRE